MSCPTASRGGRASNDRMRAVRGKLSNFHQKIAIHSPQTDTIGNVLKGFKEITSVHPSVFFEHIAEMRGKS
jgi:hypothetical protein